MQSVRCLVSMISKICTFFTATVFPLGVAARVEIESKVCKRFIMF
jgi:hypothetical protein